MDALVTKDYDTRKYRFTLHAKYKFILSSNKKI